MTDQSQLQQFLKGVECFAGLDDDSLALLVAEMRTADYAAGREICEEGDPGEWMFVVASGEVAVIKQAKDGATVQVAVLGAGDFGGMMSLFEQTPRSATLKARTGVRLWVLDHATLRRSSRATARSRAACCRS